MKSFLKLVLALAIGAIVIYVDAYLIQWAIGLTEFATVTLYQAAMVSLAISTIYALNVYAFINPPERSFVERTSMTVGVRIIIAAYLFIVPPIAQIMF